MYDTGNGCVYKPFVRLHPGWIKMPGSAYGTALYAVLCRFLSRNSHPGKWCASLGFPRLLAKADRRFPGLCGEREMGGLWLGWGNWG